MCSYLVDFTITKWGPPIDLSQTIVRLQNQSADQHEKIRSSMESRLDELTYVLSIMIPIFIFPLSSYSILGIIQFFFKTTRPGLISAHRYLVSFLLYSIQPIHACQFGLDPLGKELIYLPDRLAFLFEGDPSRTGEVLDPQSIASALLSSLKGSEPVGSNLSGDHQSKSDPPTCRIP
jgi:hypothetical protein